MAKAKRDLAPIGLQLLIVIVEKERTTFYTDLLQTYGSNIQLITSAKGTADLRILDFIGLGESDKNAIFSVIRSDGLEEVMEALEKRFHSIGNRKGLAIAVPFSSMIGTTVYGFLTGDERMGKNG